MSFTAIADDGFGVSVAAGALEGLALAFDDSDDADEQPTIATSKKSESNFTKRPFAFPRRLPAWQAWDGEGVSRRRVEGKVGVCIAGE